MCFWSRLQGYLYSLFRSASLPCVAESWMCTPLACSWQGPWDCCSCRCPADWQEGLCSSNMTAAVLSSGEEVKPSLELEALKRASSESMSNPGRSGAHDKYDVRAWSLAAHSYEKDVPFWTQKILSHIPVLLPSSIFSI